MNADSENIWREFANANHLSDAQFEQFKKLYDFLIEQNENINLTAITELRAVIRYHFRDSLALGAVVDLNKMSSIADVGTGAGFPFLPIKIVYPHLRVVALEVTDKKVKFLQAVVELLGLTNVEIIRQDWRNFLRKPHEPVDIVCARASLDVSELLRMFKPSSPYKNARLCYWATAPWEEEAVYASQISQKYAYTVGNKKRQLIFFDAKHEEHK